MGNLWSSNEIDSDIDEYDDDDDNSLDYVYDADRHVIRVRNEYDDVCEDIQYDNVQDMYIFPNTVII